MTASALLVSFIMSSEGLLRLKPWQVKVTPFLAGGALMAVRAAAVDDEVSAGASSTLGGLPTTHAALLAGVASILALAVTRFMSRIERHLVDRADGLEQSLRKANSDLQ